MAFKQFLKKALIAGAAMAAAVAQADQNPLQIEGDLMQGGLITLTTPQDGAHWVFDGKRLPVTSDGRVLVGFDRDEPAEVMLTQVAADGAKREFPLAIKQREYNIQRIEGISKRIMNPEKLDYERIRKEVAQTKAARKPVSSREDFLKPWAWPLTGPITGVFGSQRVYNGVPKRPHYGLDIARPTGTRVQAPLSGKVVLAHPDMFYSGGTLIIDHGHGLSSSFLHLSKLLVEVGQVVEQGDEIAEVGASGRATGPHLDWRMNWGKRRVDPQLLVGPMPEEGKKSAN